MTISSPLKNSHIEGDLLLIFKNNDINDTYSQGKVTTVKERPTKIKSLGRKKNGK
jgi:hypothetical protein